MQTLNNSNRQLTVMQEITIIAAVDLNNCIGLDGDLLFRIPADLKRFKDLTAGSYVIMGRKTFESIGHPLPERVNIVISKTVQSINGCIVVDSIEKALHEVGSNNAFIIGGGQVYEQMLPYVNRLNFTRVITQTLPIGELTYFKMATIDWNNWAIQSVSNKEVCPKTGLEYYFATYKKIDQDGH